MIVIFWIEVVLGRYSNNKFSSSNNNCSNNKFCIKVCCLYLISIILYFGEGFNWLFGMVRGNICIWVDKIYCCKINRIFVGLCNKELEILSCIIKVRNIRSIVMISFFLVECSYSMCRIKVNLCMVCMFFKLLFSLLVCFLMFFIY